MGGNELTDAGVAVLAAALPTSNVRNLSLAANNMEDAGAFSIAAALSEGFAPHTLDLADNLIGDDGAAEIVRLAAAQGTPLTLLELSLNPISTEARDAMLEAAREIASLQRLGVELG